MQPTNVPLMYFGKIPARGDFVRSGQQPALIHTLDRWLAQGMELMAADVRWKEIYDRAPPLQFAFLGTKSRVALAGHLMASSDSAGRRFPFIAAAGFEVAQPDSFLARSPLVLARPWRTFERAARQAHSALDADRALAELSQAAVEVETAPQAYDAACRDFIELQTIASLQGLLEQSGHRVDLRRTLLALGLLLEPIASTRNSQVDNIIGKGLRLPLPTDPLYQPQVAAWWMELASGFLRHADLELALFVSTTLNGFAPTLSIGFNGGSPTLLPAMFDPLMGRQTFVDLCDAEWAEDHLLEDHALHKLSGELQQPRLTLKQARASFCQAFAGD